MRAIMWRLTRLERSRAALAHLPVQSPAEMLRERRQRRLQAAGLPFETVRPQYPARPYMSCAETLRMCRLERRARQRAEREAAENGA
jgi:hypothetical protein